MRALRSVGSLAIVCLVALGTSCGSDDNKGDGGAGSGGAGGTGGSSGAGGSGTGGSSDSGSATYSCDVNQTGVHYCLTYDASNIPSAAPVIASWQTACTTGGGTTVTTCPTAGAIGKCTFTSSSTGYSVSQTIYYYPPATTMAGMQLCMGNNGNGVTATWTPL